MHDKYIFTISISIVYRNVHIAIVFILVVRFKRGRLVSLDLECKNSLNENTCGAAASFSVNNTVDQ